MGSVAPAGSLEAMKPFSRFVVAAPHDGGMNSMQSTDTVLQGVNADAVKDLTPHIEELQWFADIVCRLLETDRKLATNVSAGSIRSFDPYASRHRLRAGYYSKRQDPNNAVPGCTIL
jgi:hypothetical protein